MKLIFTVFFLTLSFHFVFSQTPIQDKVGGVCFRVDDHQAASKWRDWNDVFNKHGLKFSLAINASRLFNDTAARNALREIAASGHELMDHTPDHHKGFFNARSITEANSYANHPAVDHINGVKVCVKVDEPRLDFFVGEGKVNLVGNRLISVDNGGFSGINGNPYFALVYLPIITKYGVYTSVQNKDISNPDTLVIQTYWQENWPLDTLYNIDYHRIRTEDVGSNMFSNILLAERNKQLFAEYGLPIPKTWIQPGGSYALLNRIHAADFSTNVGYTAAAVNILSAQKCYNEVDEENNKRFGLQGPDFYEESQSLQQLKSAIADRSARHYASFGLSHMQNVSGGWSAFISRVDSLLQWCKVNNIPVRTYNEWASILFDSIPNPNANILPLLNKDLNENGIPDGYQSVLNLVSNDGVVQANNMSIGTASNNTNIAIIQNLGGLEKGSNLVRVYTKGQLGDSIRMLIAYPEFSRPSQSIMFAANTVNYALQERTIIIPNDVTRINISWIVIKRNNPGMVRLSYMEMRSNKTDSIPTAIPVSNILAARMALPNQLVKVRGVVSRAWGRFIYIQDATGGIGVRQGSGAMVDAIAAGNLVKGDSVEVIGLRNEFNNYAQIQLNTGAYTIVNTVIKLGSARTIEPVVLSIKQLLADAEKYESVLVRISGLRTSASGNFAASTNYTIWDGTSVGDTTLLRVIAAADTEMEDAPALAIPNDTFTFEGILAQFCSSPASNCSNGYQLYGVRKSDIIFTPSLKPFQLISPANNASVFVTAGSNAPIQITFGSAKLASARYKWKAELVNGSLNMPLLTLNSDKNGADTVLTLVAGNVDAILASLGLNKGDSVALKWTVYAYNGGDSLRATEERFITLGRNRTLSAFNLLNPMNNARVEVKKASAEPIVISWESSNTASNYTWFLDVPSGNFATPIVKLTADVNGTDTKLTLSSGAVDAVAETAGVAEGDSIDLKWTVRAYEGTDSLAANSAFNIRIVRAKPVGLCETNLNQSVLVYPNPARGYVSIQSGLNLVGANIRVVSMEGKTVLSTTYTGNTIALLGLEKGIYLLRIESTEGIASHKLVIE